MVNDSVKEYESPIDSISSINSNNSESLNDFTSIPISDEDAQQKAALELQMDRTEAEQSNNYAANKNAAEGMMDIALLSANANQLRFLITYNTESSTYYISLGLVVLSLVTQVSVGIALIFKNRMKSQSGQRYTRTNEFLVGGVFMVTVMNILLAAFTTTDGRK